MSTYREEVSQKIAPLLAPIGGPNAAGADASYDPDFEGIKAEVDKLSSVDALEPSWERIEDLGNALLASKSKDLRVISWMTVAKAKTHSWQGFAEALVLYEGLARTYWDSMYPEARRARARLNAIAWMADMVHQTLESADVRMSDGDAVRTADEALNELDRLLAEKLGDAYPGPGQLRSLMRNKVAAIPEPAPEAPPEEAQQQQQDTGTATVVEQPAQQAAPTTVEDAHESLRQSKGALSVAAGIYREADATNALAYRVQRWAAWLDLQRPPEYPSAPPYDLTQQLNEMRDSQRWLDLVKTAEAALPDNPVWLDMQRLVATALDQLGPAYAAAREAVGREVVALLGRVPELLTMMFSDGTTRLADPATESWVQGESRKWGGGVGMTAAARAAAAEEEETENRLAQARSMVTGGKVAEGLGVALALADRGADARRRFQARLAVGKMALDGAKPDLARALLEHLIADVERHGLETWEPALCATLYSYLLAATREVSRAKGDSPDLVAKAQVLFDKLCRLDPASAIKLSIQQ